MTTNKQTVGAFGCHTKCWDSNSLKTRPRRLAWRTSVARMVTHLWKGTGVCGRTDGREQRQGGNEWRSAADGRVGADGGRVTHRESYFCLRARLLPPPLLAPLPARKHAGGLCVCVHLGLCRRVQLINSDRFRAVIITLKRCNYRRGWQCESSFRVERWFLFLFFFYQLRFFPSLPVLLHQQIADWLHKALEKWEKVWG